MKKRFYLFFISLKKSAGLIPIIFSAGIIIAIVGMVLASKSANTSSTPIKVGICGEAESSYITLGTVLLEETGTIDFVEFDSEEKALDALRKMEIQGCAVIPDGFIKNALRGKNIPLQYYVLKKPVSLSGELTNEVVQMMSPVVFNSQNAVFGAIDYINDTDPSASVEPGEELSAKYIAALLQRDGLFEVINTGISDTPDLISYYTVAIVVLFVLICGTVMAPKMIKKDMSLPILLRWRGIGVSSQIMCEWSAFSLTIYVFVILLALALGQGAGFGISLLPSVLIITAMQFLLFELADSPVSGMLLHLFVSVILAYASGLLYPTYLLPETLRSIAAPLPVGQSFSLACKTFSGNADLSDVLGALIITAFILTLSIILRRIRMRGENI